MNAVAMYNAGLSIQQIAKPLAVVPRFIWTTVMFLAVIVLAVVGRHRILTFLENFLPLLGYWNTSFFVIIASEHYIFRKGWQGYKKYDLDAWDTPSKLPMGWAGGFAFAVSIVGAVLGMSQTWYVGVIAAKAGGDVGNELSFLFTLVTYIPARLLEYGIVKR
jgi:purine-cytosine permease-like protein